MKMSEKTIGQEMLDKLSYKKKNIYEEATPEKIKDIYDYSEGYKKYLDVAKTEREATEAAIELARAKGYTEYKFGDKISVGDKKYLNQHGKSLILFSVGENDLEKDGIRILAAHVDAPRLDLKQVPMYEDSGMAFLKTHYYGGIKKYQWTAIPLAIHGVMVKSDGEVVKVCIGEDDSDPVFYINDLLPHLGAKQSQEPLGSAISGETLNILIGGLPYDDKEVSDKIKLTALSILNEKYGVTEEDFISAELSLVPAFKARDIGFDRALIASYGHDDRVCSYPAVTALLDNPDTKQTVMVVLADKEEIGSVGLTGMQSAFLVDLISEISVALGKNPIVVRGKSKCLSADVTACYDPNFADVYEKRNSAMLSCGTTMSKYTGSRGKSGTNDATAEFVGFIRKLFNDNGVIWQTAELGRVDMGGGGTVAMYIANHNIETVDLGVPVISMHAPYELVSKADVYSTYEAFCAFVK
nr:aminopeptidase [Oscillospiraceae bacterium]